MTRPSRQIRSMYAGKSAGGRPLRHPTISPCLPHRMYVVDRQVFVVRPYEHTSAATSAYVCCTGATASSAGELLM